MIILIAEFFVGNNSIFKLHFKYSHLKKAILTNLHINFDANIPGKNPGVIL